MADSVTRPVGGPSLVATQQTRCNRTFHQYELHLVEVLRPRSVRATRMWPGLVPRMGAVGSRPPRSHVWERLPRSHVWERDSTIGRSPLVPSGERCLLLGTYPPVPRKDFCTCSLDLQCHTYVGLSRRAASASSVERACVRACVVSRVRGRVARGVL